MTDRNKVWFSLSISIAVMTILYFSLPEKDRSLINVLAVIGFILSILGFVIAYIQILSVKKIAKDTKKEVTDSIKLNNDIMMVSDLASKVAVVSEIQSYLKHDKIELSIVRMKDLKVTLNHLKGQESYSAYLTKNKFNPAFSNFNIDLTNCQDFEINSESTIDKIAIIKHLEELSTILLGIQGQIKNTNNA